jgi:hypothetical protein
VSPRRIGHEEGSLLAVLWLAGCGGDDDNGGGNAFLDIFNQDPDSTAAEIGDGDSLRGDMEALFGGPDEDPQEPEDVL